mmetsp:Transcript_1219/g.3435  ORF Transcript_1219/g.3435 Transcript_1219/m.3435 type:complete len:270 (+) Transcript_1219:152-961(+)
MQDRASSRRQARAPRPPPLLLARRDLAALLKPLREFVVVDSAVAVLVRSLHGPLDVPPGHGGVQGHQRALQLVVQAGQGAQQLLGGADDAEAPAEGVIQVRAQRGEAREGAHQHREDEAQAQGVLGALREEPALGLVDLDEEAHRDGRGQQGQDHPVDEREGGAERRQALRAAVVEARDVPGRGPSQVRRRTGLIERPSDAGELAVAKVLALETPDVGALGRLGQDASHVLPQQGKDLGVEGGVGLLLAPRIGDCQVRREATPEQGHVA